MSIDLTTGYGSLTLRSPIVVGACPMNADEQTRVAIESSGAGAIVLPSLFEEQIILWNRSRGNDLTMREQRIVDRSRRMQHELFDTNAVCKNAETYLSMVNRVSSQMTIPVIASLNGESQGNWLDFAGEVEEAGASAIELAVHHSCGASDQCPREMEASVVRLVKSINDSISIPLFLKLGREYTSLGDLSRQLMSGCQGIVMYGRKPDVEICLDTLTARTAWHLTSPGSIRHSIAAIMRVHATCPAMSLAACGGISGSEDVVRAILAGADVAMITSAIYRDGPDVIRVLNDGLVNFMERHHLTSMQELQSRRPLEFDWDCERAAYATALSSRLDFDRDCNPATVMHGDRFGHLEQRSTSEVK